MGQGGHQHVLHEAEKDRDRNLHQVRPQLRRHNRREPRLQPLCRQHHVVVGAAEVARRLRLLARHVCRFALAARRRHCLQKRLRVPPVILGPLALRAPGHARHGDDVAVDPHRPDLPRELEPARTRLVNEPQRLGRPLGPIDDQTRGRAVRKPPAPRLARRQVERRKSNEPLFGVTEAPAMPGYTHSSIVRRRKDCRLSWMRMSDA